MWTQCNRAYIFIAAAPNPCEPNPCGNGECLAIDVVQYQCKCPKGFKFQDGTCKGMPHKVFVKSNLVGSQLIK